jgi:hypothetical protein
VESRIPSNFQIDDLSSSKLEKPQTFTMSETIFFAISQTIYHVYMVAVVAFVALQFGWIGKPGEKKDDSRKESSQDEKPAANDLLNNLMGGLMKQMGPILERSMPRPVEAPTAEALETPSGKPVIDFE